jgi:hypothetical protein
MTEKKDKSKETNQSIEIAKVQIFSATAHEKHTNAITNAYAFFLGIFVVLLTFLLEKTIPVYAFAIGAAILFVAAAYERYLVEKVFKKELQKTSEMIEEVTARKELPSLESLLKKQD